MIRNLLCTLVAIIGIWGSIGYNMILLLAGLQEIPKDYYEAATMDGATPIKKLFSITLPLLSPTDILCFGNKYYFIFTGVRYYLYDDT